MIDIKLIRERPQYVKDRLACKGYLFMDEVVLFHDRHLRNWTEIRDNWRSAKKDLSEMISRDKSLLTSYREYAKLLNELVDGADEQYDCAKRTMLNIMMQIPNLPHESVPGGPIPYHTMVPEGDYYAR